MSFDLEDFLPYRLFRAAEQTGEAFAAIYRERYDLRRTDWRVLFNVGQYGPIGAAEIARRSGLEKSKISRAVERLENRGWLGRRPVANDRRQHHLVLTAKGARTFESLRQMAADYNQNIADVLGGPEVDALIKRLRQLDDDPE